MCIREYVRWWKTSRHSFSPTAQKLQQQCNIAANSVLYGFRLSKCIDIVKIRNVIHKRRVYFYRIDREESSKRSFGSPLSRLKIHVFSRMQGTVKMYAVESIFSESPNRTYVWKIKNLYVIGFIYNCRIYIVYFRRPVIRIYFNCTLYTSDIHVPCSILDSKKHTNTTIITA